MRDLREISKLLCKDCDKSAYEQCLNCDVHKRINDILSVKAESDETHEV